MYSCGYTILYFIVYVDDIVFMGNDSLLLKTFITRLDQDLSLKNPRHLSYILALEDSYTKDGFFLGQEKYVSDILVCTKMLVANPVYTSLSADSHLHSTSG